MIVPALLAAAQPAQSPAIFLHRLYANYRHSDYSPLSKPEQVFAPRLLSAIRKDQRLAHGEVGFLDGDPLCDCQDASGMRVEFGPIATHGDGAIGRISIVFAPSDRRHLRLKLARIANSWRIADVAAAREPSLLTDLEASNRKAGRR